jgi:hypothetical protein
MQSMIATCQHKSIAATLLAMRETTAQWLLPMQEAAEAAGWYREECHQLMSQATMPAAEADNPVGNWLAKLDDGSDQPRNSHRAIDWIRFGNLIRDRLGWQWYPDEPADS